VSAPRTVYYDHSRDASQQPSYPRGEAGPVIVTAAGEWTTEIEVWISPNSHCALVHHGVAAWLTSLPEAQGTVGTGRDVLVPPASAEDVARIFYEADRKTYGATYDFLAFAQEIPERIEYRIAIDNREYQQTLSQLQFMSTTAARHGHGLRLRI
jgi:hypothetical protein